jgi:hypothetical protein
MYSLAMESAYHQPAMVPIQALPLTALLFQITRADVSRMLRADSLHLGLGLLLVAVGLTTEAIYAARLRRSEPSLPWFGLFAFLYGLRLLARTSTIPLLFDLPRPLWAYLAAAITYVIPVPAILILRAAFPRWRRAWSWAAAAAALFAAGAIAADVVLELPDSARTPNNVIAIAFMAVSLVLLFRPRAAAGRDLRALRLGLSCVVERALAWGNHTAADDLTVLLVDCV